MTFLTILLVLAQSDVSPTTAAPEPAPAAEPAAAAPAVSTPAPAPAAPPRLLRPRLAVEAAGSGFNSGTGAALLGLSVGWGVRGGVDIGDAWGLFLHVEQNMWSGTSYGQGLVPGVLNVGVGGERRFFDGFIRTAVSLGTSILLFDTPLDRAGSAGFFADIRPLGVRWKLFKGPLTIGLDPISLTFLMPVLSGFPMARIQYRSSLSLEVSL